MTVFELTFDTQPSDLPMNGRDHGRDRKHRNRAQLLAIVDNDGLLLNEHAGRGLEQHVHRAVLVDLIGPRTEAIWYQSGDRPLDVVELGDPAMTVVVANDDTDHILRRATRREVRALHL